MNGSWSSIHKSLQECFEGEAIFDRCTQLLLEAAAQKEKEEKDKQEKDEENDKENDKDKEDAKLPASVESGKPPCLVPAGIEVFVPWLPKHAPSALGEFSWREVPTGNFP